jgi:hypothetical protein
VIQEIRMDPIVWDVFQGVCYAAAAIIFVSAVVDHLVDRILK